MISIMNEKMFWKKYGVTTVKSKPEKFVDPTTVLLAFSFFIKKRLAFLCKVV